METLKFIFMGMLFETTSILAFVETNRLFPPAKYLLLVVLFGAFIGFVYTATKRMQLKTIIILFMLLSCAGSFVFQLIGVFIYSGLLKDVVMFSLESVRIFIALCLITFIAQAIIYLGIYGVKKYSVSRQH